MKAFIKTLLRESLISEYEVLPYKKDNRSSSDYIRYNFEAAGKKYFVTFTVLNFSYYELEFGFEGQEHQGSRTKEGLKHLYNVMYTVDEITDMVVKEHKIRKIRIEGARDEKDSEGDFTDTLRTKVYVRHIKNRYPSEAVSVDGRLIVIDMTKVYPDLFKGPNMIAQLSDTFAKVGDSSYDEGSLMRNVSAHDENNFMFDNDVMTNKYGYVYMTIGVSDERKSYDIDWEIHDNDASGMKIFQNYEDLLNFIVNTFG